MPRPLSFQSTPWQVFEITSRCIQARFLLTPGDESNRRLLGVLGRAQELYGEHVRLHMVAGTSNHLHLLVSSRDSAWRARFKAHLKTNISKELGDLHGWSEHLFGRRARDIPVLDEEALSERVRYFLAHGVKEGLVARPEDWPGPPWVRALTEGKRLVGVWYRRTDYYNRARAWARRKKPDGTPAPKLADFGDEKEVTLAPLPNWSELSETERRGRFQRIVDQIHPPVTSGDAGGSQSNANVLGAAAILSQDPHHRPEWSKRTTAPRVHATSDAARFEWLEAYRSFVERWRTGLARLRGGDFLQVLPAGGVLAPPVMALVEEQPRGASNHEVPTTSAEAGGWQGALRWRRASDYGAPRLDPPCGAKKLRVHGNLTGLKASQKERLERLYHRKVAAAHVVSLPVAQSLCEISQELGRQVALTLDRNGRVVHVIVGEPDRVFLPELGRARAGKSRFRGIRLVHTHLRGEPLTHDDLTDLTRLQLDLIAAVTVMPDGRPGTVEHSHLLPVGNDPPYAAPVRTRAHEIETAVDFAALIEGLEAEFSRTTTGAIETAGQTRAIAVHVTTGDGLDPDESLRELAELASTAGVILVDKMVQRRKQLDPKYLIGQGKLDELLLRSMQLDCELVIFDQDLSPNQVRAIADATDAKVIDRSQLILDIFARRAHTREGKLQVELAQLKYTLPRLVHKSTALSRLMGGVGGRGPGETKLEIDRRRARERIHRLEREIKELGTHRQTLRRRRQDREVSVVSVVGYTNAGKSTLFNAITQSAVLVEDKLFATLDPTSRRMRFPENRELVLTDTVGFIRDLPADLVAAFKATLEELNEADLLLHVIDVSDSRFEQQSAAVERILTDLELASKPRIKVFNKIDPLSPEVADNLCRLHGAMGVCALQRQTLRPLLAEIEARLWTPPPEPRPESWMPEALTDVAD